MRSDRSTEKRSIQGWNCAARWISLAGYRTIKSDPFPLLADTVPPSISMDALTKVRLKPRPPRLRSKERNAWLDGSNNRSDRPNGDEDYEARKERRANSQSKHDVAVRRHFQFVLTHRSLPLRLDPHSRICRTSP